MALRPPPPPTGNPGSATARDQILTEEVYSGARIEFCGMPILTFNILYIKYFYLNSVCVDIF